MNRIPTSAKITIDVKVKNLKGNIEFADKDVLPLNDASLVNMVLRNIYEKEGKTFADLINEGRLNINSSKVWEFYELDENGYFVKIEKEMTRDVPTPAPVPVPEPEEKKEKKEETKVETKEETKEEAKVETKEEKKEESKKEESKLSKLNIFKKKEKTGEKEEKKGKISLRTVAKKVFTTAVALTVSYLGLEALTADWNKKGSTSPSDNSNNYRVDINEDGNVYTYNTTDEEAIENIQNNYYQSRSAELGSAIEEDDMHTQLDVIDNVVGRNEIFSFDRLVVADDYDAISAFSNMRNEVLNGYRDPHEFMDAAVSYVFGNGNYVNGHFIEDYASIHPYGKYIVIRMSQGILANCRDYSNGEFNLSTLTNHYNNIGSDLYEYLTSYYKSK